MMVKIWNYSTSSPADFLNRRAALRTILLAHRLHIRGSVGGSLHNLLMSMGSVGRKYYQSKHPKRFCYVVFNSRLFNLQVFNALHNFFHPCCCDITHLLASFIIQNFWWKGHLTISSVEHVWIEYHVEESTNATYIKSAQIIETRVSGFTWREWLLM
jgi:hypothetical protein